MAGCIASQRSYFASGVDSRETISHLVPIEGQFRPRKTHQMKTENNTRHFSQHRTSNEQIELVARGHTTGGRMALVSAAGHLVGVNDLWPEDACDRLWRVLPEVQHPLDAHGLPVSMLSIEAAR